MDRETLLKLWDESWSAGIWIAPWSKAVQGLTPAQAAWQPVGEAGSPRHSIWQMVNHVCLWREYTLKKIDPARPGPVREEMEARNFEGPARVDGGAWEATMARLKRSHDDMHAAIASVSEADLERPRYHLGHDCYHLGQIMYVRAMLGLAPIE